MFENWQQFSEYLRQIHRTYPEFIPPAQTNPSHETNKAETDSYIEYLLNRINDLETQLHLLEH